MTEFRLTERQEEQRRLMASPATHIMAFGGSRSGKTFGFVRAIVARAARAAGSRHLLARHRLSHVMQSIWHDTLPAVMGKCYPDIVLKSDKTAGVQYLPNGSELWFGGLDDRERVEKILGTEYSTIFVNEASQVSLTARNMLATRLAQSSGLALKFYLDMNPSHRQHWAHKLFVEHRQAVPPYAPLPNPDAYAALLMNPADNAANLPATYLNELQALPPRERLRFWEGRWGDNSEHALWSFETIEAGRVTAAPEGLQRVVVAVDPSGTKGAEDERSDHIGVVVVGLGLDGHAYVLEDASCKAPPHVWGNVVANCFSRHDADVVVAEINFGGAMVQHVVAEAASKNSLRIPYKEVRASRGKVVRAEPVAALYADGKVHHVGAFAALEDELTSFTTHGYMGDRSPDRADALIWALSELFPRVLAGDQSKRRRDVEVEGCGGYDPLGVR